MPSSASKVALAVALVASAEAYSFAPATSSLPTRAGFGACTISSKVGIQPACKCQSARSLYGAKWAASHCKSVQAEDFPAGVMRHEEFSMTSTTRPPTLPDLVLRRANKCSPSAQEATSYVIATHLLQARPSSLALRMSEDEVELTTEEYEALLKAAGRHVSSLFTPPYSPHLLPLPAGQSLCWRASMHASRAALEVSLPLLCKPDLYIRECLEIGQMMRLEGRVSYRTRE